MAYFQMDKNPKSNQLETDKDFSQLADRFYKQAQTYMEFLVRNVPNIIECTEPLIANAAFTCELYLKSLLLRERFNFYTIKKPENKHDLFDLYNHLSQQIREKIKSIHPCTNEKRENFELALKECGKAFEVLRYCCEYGEMATNVQFLVELAWSLAEISYNKAHGKE